jgi:hypothetical protein
MAEECEPGCNRVTSQAVGVYLLGLRLERRINQEGGGEVYGERAYTDSVKQYRYGSRIHDIFAFFAHLKGLRNDVLCGNPSEAPDRHWQKAL